MAKTRHNATNAHGMPATSSTIPKTNAVLPSTTFPLKVNRRSLTPAIPTDMNNQAKKQNIPVTSKKPTTPCGAFLTCAINRLVIADGINIAHPFVYQYEVNKTALPCNSIDSVPGRRL